MKSIINFLTENKISFNVIEPDINYSDEYKIEVKQDNDVVGYLIYIDISDDMFENYIDPEDDQDVLDYISENYDMVRFISELHINKEYRNNMFGSKLLKYFINKFSNKPVLLYASNYDGGTGDLSAFYKKFGFKEINDSNYFILDKK